jgi:hypothetical protein
MKKNTTLFVACTFIVNGQDKWSTNKAIVTFEASVPFFEPIQAENIPLIAK